MRAMMTEELPQLVYSFPMFSHSFCETLLGEAEHYEGSGMRIQRLNSMNNYGLILNQVGMEHWMSMLQLVVTQPISNLIFPDEGEFLDSHHSFTVRYMVSIFPTSSTRRRRKYNHRLPASSSRPEKTSDWTCIQMTATSPLTCVWGSLASPQRASRFVE